MGILFDLDGTLLDTIDDIASVTNHALLKNGFAVVEKNKYAQMVGHGLKDLVRQALPADANAGDIENVYKSLIEEYLQKPVTDSKVYPGIPGLLDALSRKNIPMAILSNKMHEITTQIVSILFARWNFVAVFGSRTGIPRKPDPCAALEISQIMSVKPGEIFFIGDSEADMATAVAAGMRPVGVSWGYRSVEDIRKAGAEKIIHDPLELLNFLNLDR